jgi:hypothetical protein
MGMKLNALCSFHEEAQEWRLLMVGTEVLEEATVSDEAAPTLANKEARRSADGCGGRRRKISRRASSS